MRGSKRAVLAQNVTETLLRVVNQIHEGRRTPRDYGGGRKMTLIETEMCAQIAQHEGITGVLISQKLGVTRSATSQYIAKLKSNGCVRVGHDENNAKLKRIYLTSVGKKSARLAGRYTRMMEEQIFACSDEELAHYLNFVTKLEKFHKKVVGMLMGDNAPRPSLEASEHSVSTPRTTKRTRSS